MDEQYSGKPKRLVSKVLLNGLFLFAVNFYLTACSSHRTQDNGSHSKGSLTKAINGNSHKMSCKNFMDSGHVIQRTFFAERYINALRSDLLRNKDSIIDKITLSNQSFIETKVNDSLYYLVYFNTKTGIKKIIQVSSVSQRRYIFGNYLGKLTHSFIWGYGSATGNKDWLLFDCLTGEFIASGGSYLGKCSKEGYLFFLYKNCLLCYSEEKQDVFVVLDFTNLNKSYGRLNYDWEFDCSDKEWKIIYHGEFTDTIEYNPK